MSKNFVPVVDGEASLGKPSKRWKELRLSMQITLSPVASTGISNNSLFVDSSDNLLKFKDNTGAIKTVTIA